MKYSNIKLNRMKNSVSKLKKTSKVKFIFSLILIINQFIVLSQTKYNKDELVNLFETDATLLIREKTTNKIVENGIVEFIENDEKSEIKIERGYKVYYNLYFRDNYNTWLPSEGGWYLRDRSEYNKGIESKRVEFGEKEKNGWVYAYETYYDENGKIKVTRGWHDYQKVLAGEIFFCGNTYCSQTSKKFYPSGGIAEIEEIVNENGLAIIKNKTCYDINGKVINCDSINWTEIHKNFFGN